MYFQRCNFNQKYTSHCSVRYHGNVRLFMIKAAIQRFSIRIGMRISIRIRNISMQTPYSTLQYPSNVYVCCYLILNSAYNYRYPSHEHSTPFIQNVVTSKFFKYMYVLNCKDTIISGRLWI